MFRSSVRPIAILLSLQAPGQNAGERAFRPEAAVARCVLEDRRWRRRIVIEKVGAWSSVVWNPWAEKVAAMADLRDSAWRGMVCVVAGNIADDKLQLAADGEHQMSVAISVIAPP